MSASTVQPPLTVDPPLPRKLFAAPEVEQMLESGIFAGQRFELIDGELINKMGQEPPHASAIRLCTVILLNSYRLKPVELSATESRVGG